jgi:hypothetical protein
LANVSFRDCFAEKLQIAAKLAREACGKPGRRKADDLTASHRTRIRSSRARPKPSLPPATIGDLMHDASLMQLCDCVANLGFASDKK